MSLACIRKSNLLVCRNYRARLHHQVLRFTRPQSLVPPRNARGLHIFSLRLQEASSHIFDSEALITSPNEVQDGPVITYEPTDSPTSEQRSARKHLLGLDVLGKPAEVLVLDHPESRKRFNSLYADELDDEPEAASALSTSDLLKTIEKEQGFINVDQACENLEHLRRSVFTQNTGVGGYVEAAKLNHIISQLRSGFKSTQLLAYIGRAQQALPNETDLSKDYQTWQCSRSAWMSGPNTSKKPIAPPLLPREGAKPTSHPFIVPSNAKKEELLQIIVTRVWGLNNQAEENEVGDLDMRLLPIHFDLITSSSEQVLKKICDTYGVKIEASKPQGTVRISSDRNTCGDIYKLIKHTIGEVQCSAVNVRVLNNSSLDASSRLAMLENIEKATSTVIREIQAPSLDSDARYEVYYLGREVQSYQDASRLLATQFKDSRTKKQKLKVAAPLYSWSLAHVPCEAGKPLLLPEKSTQWSRWITTSMSNSTQVFNADRPIQPSDARRQREYHEAAFKASLRSLKLATLPPLQLARRASSFWSTEPTYLTTASPGQISFPAHLVKSAQRQFVETLRLKRALNVRFQDNLSQWRRDFVSSGAGLLRTLGDKRPKETETLLITLTPTPRSSQPASLLEMLPEMELEIAIDNEKKQTKLSEARLVVREIADDILLPTSALDLRLIKRAYIRSKEFDSSIMDFVESSKLNIWGHDRLITPNKLSINVPECALSPPSAKDGHHPKHLNLQEGLEMEYTFACLEHRSGLKTQYDVNTDLTYTMIEAGRTGGRREEVTLTNRPMTDYEKIQLRQSLKRSQAQLRKYRQERFLQRFPQIVEQAIERKLAQKLWRSACQLILDAGKVDEVGAAAEMNMERETGTRTGIEGVDLSFGVGGVG